MCAALSADSALVLRHISSCSAFAYYYNGCESTFARLQLVHARLTARWSSSHGTCSLMHLRTGCLIRKVRADSQAPAREQRGVGGVAVAVVIRLCVYVHPCSLARVPAGIGVLANTPPRTSSALSAPPTCSEVGAYSSHVCAAVWSDHLLHAL